MAWSLDLPVLLDFHDGWIDGRSLGALVLAWGGLYVAGFAISERGHYLLDLATLDRLHAHLWELRFLRPRYWLWIPTGGAMVRFYEDPAAVSWPVVGLLAGRGLLVNAVDILLVWGGPAVVTTAYGLPIEWAVGASWCCWSRGPTIAQTVGRACAGGFAAWLWLAGYPGVVLALLGGTLLGGTVGLGAHKATASHRPTID